MILWVLAIMLLAYFWLNAGENKAVHNISYTEFKQKVSDGDVASVTFNGDELSGVYKKQKGMSATTGGAATSKPEGKNQQPSQIQQQNQQPTQPQSSQQPSKEAQQKAPNPLQPATSANAEQTFYTTLPPVNDPQLMPLLQKNHVVINAKSQQSSIWTRILVGVLPWVILFGLFFFLARRAQQSMMGSGGDGIFGFGKSKAKRFHRGESDIKFDDVAGLENAKQDLREITAYLKDPDYYRKLGAKVPKGILLMGPPGVGKTMLAKAVAGEADAAFYSISGSEFIEMFVGVGASRVRDMFASAKKEAPSIIFIDEIDSVGRIRGAGLGGGHDEREQTLNQILGEMDGFNPHEAVVVLAATNRPDVLDPALLRPGRFDRKISLDLPDRKARLAILRIHSRHVPMAEDVDLERIAALTPGFSGAYLENLINEAALLVGREHKIKVDMAAMLAARDKVIFGAPSETVINEAEKKTIAYHESGHAVAASFLPNADPLDKVTIIPRGRSLGATEQIPDQERHNLSESYLRDRIGVMLGGRIAERVIFGEVTSGSEEDLKQATRLARHMVSQWGMSSKLGPVAFRGGEEHIFLGKELTQQRDFSEDTAHVIDEEVSEILKKIERSVNELMENHRGQLEALASALVEKETMGAEEISAIMHAHYGEQRQPKAEAAG